MGSGEVLIRAKRFNIGGNLHMISTDCALFMLRLGGEKDAGECYPCDGRFLYAFTRLLSLLGSYPWQGSSDYFLTSGDKIRFFFEKGVLDERGKL